MPVEQSELRSTRVPDQLPDLSAELASVSASQQYSQLPTSPPLVFGNFDGVNMSGQTAPGQAAPTQDMLLTLIEPNRLRATKEVSKLRQSFSGMRQDDAAAFEALSTTLSELQRTVSAVKAGNTPGPIDQIGVADALCDPAARKQAIRAYGLPWLLKTKEQKLWPPSAFDDEDFMEAFYALKQSGNMDLATA
ncbi:hypothetical protein ABBQ32_006031 [Trebouxia sp. C0010 RCD-2024]